MFRWGMALAALTLLGLAADAPAQLPTGNGRVQFVPIDTTRNLATPIPTVNLQQPKGSYFEQFYNALKSILPFTSSSRRNPLSPPMAPVMQLPKSVQQQQAKQPTFKLPEIPKIPPLISGGAR